MKWSISKLGQVIPFGNFLIESDVTAHVVFEVEFKWHSCGVITGRFCSLLPIEDFPGVRGSGAGAAVFQESTQLTDALRNYLITLNFAVERRLSYSAEMMNIPSLSWLTGTSRLFLPALTCSENERKTVPFMPIIFISTCWSAAV